jgi:hypothetical protein
MESIFYFIIFIFILFLFSKLGKQKETAEKEAFPKIPKNNSFKKPKNNSLKKVSFSKENDTFNHHQKITDKEDVPKLKKSYVNKIIDKTDLKTVFILSEIINKPKF